MFVPLLQDVVRVTDLLPDVHGLGRRGGQSMPTLPWASWFCPHHLGQGLRDLAFLAGLGEANGDRTWKGLTGDQPSPLTFIQLPAGVWGGGRAELPHCLLSHRPRGTPAPCSCGRPPTPCWGFLISVQSPFLSEPRPPTHCPLCEVGVVMVTPWPSHWGRPSLASFPPSPGPSSWMTHPSSSAHPECPRTLPAPCQ